jgi:hypothetical protein
LPLSKRARIEVYLPERRKPNYRRLKKAIEREFLETFGGCTVIMEIKGLYLSSEGKPDFDKIDLIYADTPFDFDKNFSAISKYADALRSAALEVTEEESLLIVVHGIYHSV